MAKYDFLDISLEKNIEFDFEWQKRGKDIKMFFETSCFVKKLTGKDYISS